MTRQNRGLVVSMTAGLIVVLLLFVVLVAHVLASNPATAEASADHATALPVTSTELEAPPATHVMPDGSIMYNGDMGAQAMQHDAADAATGHAGHGAAAESTAGTSGGVAATQHSTQHSMGGPIDWEVIGLILALIAACVALTAAVNEHLRKRIAAGAFVQGEAGNG